MIIAGVIIETLPGRAAGVSARLVSVPGLTLHGGDGDSRIAAVWNSGTAQSLEEVVGSLVELDEDVVGVYPTFVAEDQWYEAWMPVGRKLRRTGKRKP